MAERPWPHGAGGVFIDPVEHARIAKMTVGRRKSPVDLVRPKRREHLQERPPVLAHPAVMIHHLVEVARQRLIARQERFETAVSSRGAVEMASHAGHQT